MLFLTGFLISFQKKNKEQANEIKTLRDKVAKPKLTEDERKEIIDAIKESLTTSPPLPIDSDDVDTTDLKGLLNEDLMAQTMRLARLNNEILFKEDRATELDTSIETLKQEIKVVEELVAEKRKTATEMDSEVTNKRVALMDMLTRAQVERDQVQMEVQALSEEKLRLQKDIDAAKKLAEVSNQDMVAVQKRLGELIELEKEMRLRSAREILGHGMALEFDEIELVEIKELREVLVRLRNATPLEKAIYEIYYRDKMKRVVGVLGLDGVSGIYRIWTVDEGIERNYVGQSVNIGDRWIQHLKRMVGAEEPTGIVLYAAAKKIGVENLKWECIEKCDRKDLSEREKY